MFLFDCTTCQTGMLGTLARSRFETLVAVTVKGGARPRSRGVEGVTGCSGEGLHPSTWTITTHFKIVYHFEVWQTWSLGCVCLF